MKKRILSLLIFLFALSIIGCSSEKPEAWQNAYETFLNDYEFLNDSDIIDLSDENTIYSYAVRDLDDCGVSELLLFQQDSRNALNAVLTVYSYDGNVYKIGQYSNLKGSFIGGFRLSENPLFPGLFEVWWGGGEDHYGYLSIEDGELVYEYLWHDDRTIEPPHQTMFSDNQEIINESFHLHLLDNSTDNLLEIYLINSENIDEIH